MIEHSFLFVINPKAGLGRNHLLEKMIRDQANSSRIKIEIRFTAKAGDAAAFAQEAVDRRMGCVVAVGGDGTINEIASKTMLSATAIGIVPGGSGNGLARHYNIPLNPYHAIQRVFLMKGKLQDAVSINGMMSFNISGIGLDAKIAQHFGENGKRGFGSYMKLLIRELPSYEPHSMKIKFQDQVIEDKYLMACICTGSQFGNNARINPHGDPIDRKTELVCVNDVPFYGVPRTIARAFSGDISKSKYVHTMQQNNFTISCDTPAPLHIDGEPKGYHNEFIVESKPESLYIIVA